ncbi:hypothetical protein [Rhodococcus sp. NPDC127528]|uniref:hypothetical protein n=1 Tax=unclassified Rhodococcus (in: high G+C Gram-positive bacteria) TaxID=192944 RepID=UPI003624C965
MTDSVLERAAFGDTPGAPDLPAATDARGHWLRAVALGGQGRYAAARAELAELRRCSPGPVLASLAASTEASLLRQLGWHALAAGHDGRALALIGDPGVGPAGESAAARCDALTGLAADALGCGRFPLGFRLLERCGAVADRPDPALWRQRIRWHWVNAEMSLATGDAEAGRRHAAAALELAGAGESVRHQVKSALLLAAAQSAGPDPAAAAGPAARVLDSCAEHGLVPLQWAASMLLGGVQPSDEATAVRALCERRIAGWGGRFREL